MLRVAGTTIWLVWELVVPKAELGGECSQSSFRRTQRLWRAGREVHTVVMAV